MKYKLEDISLKISKGSTPRGKVNYSSDENNLFLRVTDLSELQHVETAEYTLSDDDIKKNKMKIWPSNTVLVSIEGTVGKVAILKKPMAFNQAIAGIIPDEEKVIPEYLMYYLRQTPTISSILKGTIMPALRLGDLSNIELDLPDLRTQQKIVRILSALDQKIELNNKQNRIIEEEASILIRKYNNYEKGTTKLKEVMSFDNGFAFKSKDYVNTGKYKVVTIKNVQDGLIDSSSAQFVTNYPKDMRDCHKLSVGDVLLSLTGNVGRVGIVFEENLLLNQRVAKMKPKDKSILPFLYFFFRQSDFKQKLEALAKGTAQLNLSPVETLNEEITYSEQSALDLSNSLKPFFEKIVLNNQNNKTLSCVRDSLLLKLMSGKINLDKVTV